VPASSASNRPSAHGSSIGAEIEAAGVTILPGSYSSAEASSLSTLLPAATSTLLPVSRRVAVWNARAVASDPTGNHVLLAGSYNSAEARYSPPVTSIWPESRVAVWCERALASDLEGAVDDLHLVYEQAIADYPGPPAVLIGHSMGGLIAARYGQRYGSELAALVLSVPAVGGRACMVSRCDWQTKQPMANRNMRPSSTTQRTARSPSASSSKRSAGPRFVPATPRQRIAGPG